MCFTLSNDQSGEIMSKKCSKCDCIKELSEFYSNKKSKDGLSYVCKECIFIYKKEHYKNNKEKYRKRSKKYEQSERGKILAKKAREKSKTKKAEYDITYRSLNKNKIREYKKEWHNKNKDNELYKIKKNLRRRIHHVLKGDSKSDNTSSLLGCTFEEFKIHIESQFEDGMTWDNYGFYGWHIDHIIPCYKFDLKDPEQQKICFNYKNQRPLWAKDNLSRKRD